MKTGFIDWTEGNINFYVFDQQRHIDTLTVPFEGKLNSYSLTPLLVPNIDRIYLSVPVSLLTLRELSFPFSDRMKIKDTIAFELEGLLLGSVHDYSIDHMITESFDNGCKVLTVCMEKLRLNEIINTFSSAGLDPQIITSIDLRLSGGKSASLFEGSSYDRKARTGAASEEIINPSLNLRQDELAYTGNIERMKKTLRITASLVLVLLLILGGHAALKYLSGKKENKALTRELQNVYSGAFPEDSKIVDAARQFKGNLNTLKEKKSLLEGIPILDILNNIANLKNRNITLIEFSADGKNLIIKGTALSFEEMDSFRNSLGASFNGVKVLNSDATVDKKINFTIIMQEKTA